MRKGDSLLTRERGFPTVARVPLNLAAPWRWAPSLGLAIVLAVSAACGPIRLDLRGLRQEAPEAGSGMYVVRHGDTLSGIAAAHGTTVEALIQLNLTAYPSLAESQGRVIVTGWRLSLPAGVEPVTAGRPVVVEPEAAALEAPHPAGVLDEAGAAEVVRLTNQERIRHGLEPLTVDPGLVAVAQVRAQAVVSNYSHDGIKDLCNCGENLARLVSRAPAAAFFSGWLASEGHRQNILSPEYRTIGAAIYRLQSAGVAYAVQVFAR